MTHHRIFITSNTTGTLAEKERLTLITFVLSILGIREVCVFQILSFLEQINVVFLSFFFILTVTLEYNAQ
jgi:hypothetical protein